MDFSKFDQQIDLKKLAKDIEEAAKNGTEDFPVVPAGKYVVRLVKLELGETKDHRPMLKGQFQIAEGEFKKQYVFYNRVIYGTKNDANMISSAVSFLKKLEPSENVGAVLFTSYMQFADLVLDIAEDVVDVMEYEIKYNPDAFNSISIDDAFVIGD